MAKTGSSVNSGACLEVCRLAGSTVIAPYGLLTLQYSDRYSASFADRFSRFLHSFCTPTTRIAFLSCPTAYVGFQHTNPLPSAYLFEYDARFGLVAGDKFVKYDLEDPLKFPEELRGKVDIAIADPPFLNEVCARRPAGESGFEGRKLRPAQHELALTTAAQVTNRYFAQTLRSLLSPSGKLVLLTSTSVSSLLPSIYDSAPVGPLYRTSLEVEHAGSRLQNAFGVWTSWEWDGEREEVKVVGLEKGA